jgi:hypothetical protein
MKVTTYGVLKNGIGLVDFVTIDIVKMMNLCNDQLSFYLMNFFIINVIEKSISGNGVSDWIDVEMEKLQDHCLPSLTEKSFLKSLKKLRKLGLIEYGKIRGKDIFSIQIL